nr:hypothetical protein [Tanacetum cinerariifolium]
MTEAVREAVQIQTDWLQDSLQRENDEFLRTIDDNMKKIIKERVKSQVKAQVIRILPRIEESVNAQLETEVLTRSSHSSRTSYAVAADLSEMELKKILIDKMEGNKSIQREDDDDQEGPSAGSDRGSKRQRDGGEHASASTPSKPATGNTPIDFSNFIMNRLGVNTLTPKLLAVPTYELMRGSCNSLTELGYHLEEVYKATTDYDGTLNDVRNALDDRLKEIRMEYFPTIIWRRGDKDRAAAMIHAIDKMLKTRRNIRSLERFVGGRQYEGDF